MAAFTKLEEINVWTASKKLALQIYKQSKESPASDDFAYLNQLRRAAISIMSNIAEGFGRNSDKEFAHFLSIARGSAMETKSLLSLGVDLGYFGDEDYKEIDEETSHVIAQLTTLGQYLRGTPKRQTSRKSQ